MLLSEELPVKQEYSQTMNALYESCECLCDLIRKIFEYYSLIFPNGFTGQKDFTYILSSVSYVETELTRLKNYSDKSESSLHEKMAENLRSIHLLLVTVSYTLDLIESHLGSLSVVFQARVLNRDQTQILHYLMLDLVRLKVFFSKPDKQTVIRPFDHDTVISCVYVGLNGHINSLQSSFVSLKPVKGYLIDKFTFKGDDYQKLLEKALEIEKQHVHGANYLLAAYKKTKIGGSKCDMQLFISDAGNFKISEFKMFYEVKSPVDFQYSTMNCSLSKGDVAGSSKNQVYLNVLTCFLINMTQVIDLYIDFMASRVTANHMYFQNKFLHFNGIFKSFLKSLYFVSLRQKSPQTLPDELKSTLEALMEFNFTLNDYNCKKTYKALCNYDSLESDIETRVANMRLLNYYFSFAAVEGFTIAKDPMTCLIFENDKHVTLSEKLNKYVSQTSNGVNLFDFFVSSLKFGKFLNTFCYSVLCQNGPLTSDSVVTNDFKISMEKYYQSVPQHNELDYSEEDIKRSQLNIVHCDLDVTDPRLGSTLLKNLDFLSESVFSNGSLKASMDDLDMMVELAQSIFEGSNIPTFNCGDNQFDHSRNQAMNEFRVGY